MGDDFKDFLKLLNSHRVEYLVIGGYAVAYHGYPRPTGDLDVWVGTDPANIDRLIKALREFGFDLPELTLELFAPGKVIRMGVSPDRIEILQTISGLDFRDVFARRLWVELDTVPCFMIALADLRRNKVAANRAKDQSDLKNLPGSDEA